MIHNLDKKANGIHYDKNTSGLNADNVQGAIDELNNNVADVQTQINNLEEFGYWKPNSNNYGSDRCYYIKTKNMLTVYFCFYPVNTISTSTYWLCTNVKTTFNVTNFAYSNALCYNGVGNLGRVAFSTESNIIGINILDKNLVADSPIYGQISCHIY